MFYVSRQSNYYDDGAYSVEVARRLDCSGPGTLVARYAQLGEGDEYDNPHDAVEAAIAISRAWRGEIGRASVPFRCFTIAGNAFVYSTVKDAMTIPELRAWARGEWDALKKCDRCGDPIMGETWRLVEDPDIGDFCSENCCDRAMEDMRDAAADDEAQEIA